MRDTLFEMPVLSSDVVYTPEYVSKQVIEYLNPKGIILDPCRGEGAFHKYLPDGSPYCEISEGKDFFEYTHRVDWVIGNPPYSIFLEFLQKSFEISDNVSFLVPTNKVFQRQVVMDKINEWGGIKSILIYGSGNLIQFPFGFSVGNFHFQKKFKGETKIIMGIKEIFK